MATTASDINTSRVYETRGRDRRNIMVTVTDINSSTRAFLLRMGNTWLEKNELRQAIDVFLKITEEYPESDECNIAKLALLKISQRYEKEGELRLSLDVLERLEQCTT
jgi:outer membrane protein assembly factor BamD (BamD/ComL family)